MSSFHFGANIFVLAADTVRSYEAVLDNWSSFLERIFWCSHNHLIIGKKEGCQDTSLEDVILPLRYDMD
jgi:hypothetical protein